jgi:predicted nuclease of predicted toxin-antitoxin system
LRFLLDINLPSSLVSRLSHLGHEAIHSGKLGLAKATDEALLSLAESREMVLLTHDLDFGQLMAFSRKRKPSIVIFRVQKTNSLLIEKLLMKSWKVIEKPLLEGAIVVIEEKDFRIRPLPIGGADFDDQPALRESPAIYKTTKSRSKKK